MKKHILFLALFALAACAQDAPPPAQPVAQVAPQPTMSAEVLQQWVAKAKYEELRGNYAQAVQDYQQVLNVQPANRELRLAMANAYRRMGDNDRALAIYAELLKQDPSLLAAKEGGAMAMIAKGDYDSTVNVLDGVIKADPKRPQALNGMGVLFTTRNLNKDAQQYFNEALKYAPNDPEILSNLGLSQALESNYKASLASLSAASNAAIAGSYDRKRVDMNIALVHAASGKPQDSLAVAGAYYAGSQYSAPLGMYARIASDKKLAATYLHNALTNGRPYFDQWDAGAARPAQ